MPELIKVGEIFEVSKTPDKFFDVQFQFPDGKVWNGALPIHLRYQGFDIEETNESLLKWANECYKNLSTEACAKWDQEILFPALKKEAYGPDTTKVLGALQSGEWECRVCGPVPQANAQPAARLRDLKQNGFCIATKRIPCENCGKSTFHDLLVKIPIFDKSTIVQRFTISNALKTKIYKVFGYREACFSRKETPRNLIIDHKFPSDRWKEGETLNHNNMTEAEIRDKFQLLTNQTNMMKNRVCFNCVETGIRGDFMGIRWYPHGDEHWRGEDKYDEAGCIGCPWYDLEHWKEELQKTLDHSKK